MNETTIKTRKVNVYHLDLVALREGKTYRFPQGPFTKREHVSRNGGRNPVGKDYAFRFVKAGMREERIYNRTAKLRAHHGAKFSVNVYERYQSYGGPEEGGWWYHGQGIVSNRQFRALRAAQRYLARLKREFVPFTDTVLCSDREKLSEWQDGSLSGFSVLDGYGQGKVVELEPHPLPARADTSRPHYC